MRGFVVSPDFVMKIAPSFRVWMGDKPPSWADLSEAAFYVRAELGISQHAWGQACQVLGRLEAVVTLATIDAKQHQGLVKSAGGLLRRMVDLHQAGELRLDRTLFGLADGLNGVKH